MSAGRSIQISITHTVIGIGLGSVIDGMLPKFSADASLANQVFETLVQMGLNGAALVLVAGILRDNDPTYGIPFSMALFQAQPELGARILALSDVMKDQVVQAAQRTVPRTAGV